MQDEVGVTLGMCIHLPTLHVASLEVCLHVHCTGLPTHPVGVCDVWIESRNVETY